MKPISIFLLSSFLAISGFVSAQVFFTNNVGRGTAIIVASRLNVGMKEEDASKLLAQNGLTNGIGLGAMTGWGRFYSLTDGSSLVLDYTAREVRFPWGGNGSLQRAFIQQNGSNIISITITNKP
jgi:hypothetical protein